MSAFIVNNYFNHPAQRTIGAFFMVSGLLWLIMFFNTLPKFLFVILVFYLIKVSFSFAVNHFAHRDK